MKIDRNTTRKGHKYLRRENPCMMTLRVEGYLHVNFFANSVAVYM